MGEGLGGLSGKGEGIRIHSYKIVRDVKYSIENAVNNIVITTFGAR